MNTICIRLAAEEQLGVSLAALHGSQAMLRLLLHPSLPPTSRNTLPLAPAFGPCLSVRVSHYWACLAWPCEKAHDGILAHASKGQQTRVCCLTARRCRHYAVADPGLAGGAPPPSHAGSAALAAAEISSTWQPSRPSRASSTAWGKRTAGVCHNLSEGRYVPVCKKATQP